jgi:DNA-binding LacI/PurR family transcriptional regulator
MVGSGNGMRGRGSLKEVAEAAGVAVSTVSRYLSGQLTLRSETEARLRAALESLGFQEAPQGQRATGNRARPVVGLAVPHTANSYYGRLSDAIIRAADALDMYVVMVSTLDNPSKQIDYVNLLASFNLNGLLYVGTYQSNEALSQVINSGLPTVILDEEIQGVPPTFNVLVDDYAGAYQAVTYLCSQGHRDIALLTGPLSLRSSRERERAYRDVLARFGIDPAQQTILQGPFTEEFGAAAFARILSAARQPTAVFAASDVIAVGLVGAAASCGVTIPADISVVGFDDLPESRLLMPPLTTVRTPLSEMANTAVARLFDLLSDRSDPPETILVPVTLEVRGSVQARRRPAADESAPTLTAG